MIKKDQEFYFSIESQQYSSLYEQLYYRNKHYYKDQVIHFRTIKDQDIIARVYGFLPVVKGTPGVESNVSYQENVFVSGLTHYTFTTPCRIKKV